MTSGGQRIESSLESGSRSDRESSESASSSPEISSRSDTQSDREQSPSAELVDRVRSEGASPRGETDLRIVPFEEDRYDGEASEHVEDEVDEGGEEENEQGEGEEQGEEVGHRRKGSKRKGAIKNRLVDIPSQMTAQRLEEFQLRYSFRGELMAPGPEDRPWYAPEDRNVQLGAFPENFHENIQKIRAVGIQHWPDIHRRRVEAAITRITNASWRRENQLRERAIAMSPIQVNAPSLAARLRANRSSGGNKSRESLAQSDRSTQATAPQIVNEVEARQDSDLVEDRAQTVEPEAGAQEEGQAVAEGPDETARRSRKEAKKLKRKEKKKKDKDEVETTQLTEGANQPEVDESAAKEGSRKRTSGEVVAELFGLIKGSTSEVPAADDAVFKDMAGYAFKLSNTQSVGQRAMEERDAAIARRKSAEEKWQVEKRRSKQLEEA
ncbi:caldesmon-like [Eutrema salsugineum]|uniref:caldesmon-like n=1 Tax=Eutrema salsugineum TaxID=72664 RepID=UPI000CED5303|nr:caldesmon-like [Eutrema salsugineum]